MCPPDLQDPRGKVIPISVIGVYPYVVYGADKEWAGGTEFQVIDVYAKKFGFTPELMRATGYDNEGSVVDMVRRVIQSYQNVLFYTLSDRLTEKSVKLV